MVTAIKQQVTIQAGGVVEVRSPELPPGEQVEVIVLMEGAAIARPAEPVSASWARLRRFAGAVDSGDPNSSDNERIDADLARAYLATNDPRT